MVEIASYVGVVVDQGVGHFTGVQSCGSVWACAVCSAAKREEHAARIQAVVTASMLAGCEVDFLVMTMPHSIGDRLSDLLDAGSKAWGTVTTSRGYRTTNPLGCLRSWEVTDGMPNGWHPHLNALVFHPPGERTPEQRQAFSDYATRTWADAVERELGRRPSDEHGVKCQPVKLVNGQADVAAYVAKVQDGFDSAPPAGWGIGREIARGDVKNGRRASRWSPFMLAERAAAGEAWAVARWHEYEQATFGRRCVEWSRSARWKGWLAGLGLDEVPPVDDQAAVAVLETEGVVVLEMSHAEWQLVTRYTGQLHMLRQAETLGLDGCLAYLSALRARQRLDDRRAMRRLAAPVLARA